MNLVRDMFQGRVTAPGKYIQVCVWCYSFFFLFVHCRCLCVLCVCLCVYSDICSFSSFCLCNVDVCEFVCVFGCVFGYM
jgi:hypothetical protein